DLSSPWKYPVDNQFAKPFVESIPPPDRLSPYSSSSELCDRCCTVDLRKPISLSDLRETTRSCDLCRMLSQRFRQRKGELKLLDHRSGLRICADPETQTADSEIQIGFPVLPESGGPIHFELIRAWLRDCDKDPLCRGKSSARLPTRVLDVGFDKTSDTVKLHISKLDEPGKPEYIALSHCWGNLTKQEKDKISTSHDNWKSREQGFDMKELPQTFQDAIIITRELGKQYLWIDAICIIQADNDDWARESKLMETVFENAYCTIAATSAENSTTGFLTRPPEQHEYVRVPSSSHGPVYVCADIDQFDADVENGPLNQRAWVLQERALSRRTIHFAASQIYWECGHGIRCETLTQMRNTKALFLSDPKFPESLFRHGDEGKIQLFQSLFIRYTHLGLTEPTDRPVAIFGLQERLVTKLRTQGRHGVFEDYLHRSLLWERSGPKRMSRILYATNRKVPSWSWMAYDGQIAYMKIPFNQVEWSKDILWPEQALKAEVMAFQPCKIKRKDDETCVIEDETGNGERGWLKFDGADSTDVRTLKCVIVGRESKNAGRKYYVLVVTPICSEGCRTFERVGVGSIPERFILFESRKVDRRIL
ncbi:heterokaryon incompatibility protein-domain-containing protein, partial [Diaporthe sp. PMI_573]